MKKRLRKKLHKKEFQEMGFEIDFHYSIKKEEDSEELLDRFIDMIESLGLCIGGGFGNDKASFFVANDGRGTVTQQNRQDIINWLNNQTEISNIQPSELRDAWYGW